MIVTKRLAPPNSVLLVMDQATGEPPQKMDGVVAATASCVAIGTLCEVDGETLVEVSDEGTSREVLSETERAFRGVIATPSRRVLVCTAALTPVAELPVSADAATVEVWTNDRSEPDRVVILVGAAAESFEPLDIGPRPADAVAGPVWREIVGPGRTVTLGEAVELAERALAASDMGVLAVQEFDFGWVMALQGRRYLATRDFLDQLVGHGLTIVERATGDVYCSGSASPGWAAVLGYFKASARHRGGPNTFALPSPTDRHPSLSYEHLPGFGDYIYGDGTRSWTQRRQDAAGRPLLLRGRSRRPTPEQIALLDQIDADIDRLSAVAIAAVQPPHPDHFRAVAGAPMFVRQDLTLREVRLEDDGTFVLFFDSPTGDAIDVWPMVIFRNWSVESAGWVP